MTSQLPRSSDTIEAFEGLRGVAALGVVFIHTLYFDNFFTRQAYLFVDLFFLISGFLMARLYADALTTWEAASEFILRRIGRLYPLLIASTLLYLSAKVVQKVLGAAGVAMPMLVHDAGPGHTGASTLAITIGERLAQYVTTVTMTHGLGFFDAPFLNTPSWSISTEFYTYIVFALVCLLAPVRHRLGLFAVLALVGYVIAVEASLLRHHCLIDNGPDLCMNVHYDYGIFRCIGGFFAGALLSRMPAPRFVDAAGKSSWLPPACRSGAVVLPITVVVLFWLAEHHHWVALLVPPVLAMLVYSVSTDTGAFARLLRRKPFQFLGKVSYSVYLLHWPLMQYFEIFVPSRPNPIVAIVFVAVLLGLSWLSYNRIERPARDWFRRFAARFGEPQRLRSKATSV